MSLSLNEKLYILLLLFKFSYRCSPGGSEERIHSCTHPAPRSVLTVCFHTVYIIHGRSAKENIAYYIFLKIKICPADLMGKILALTYVFFYILKTKSHEKYSTGNFPQCMETFLLKKIFEGNIQLC